MTVQPNHTLADLMVDAANLGFLVTRQNERTYSIGDPAFRRSIRVNMTETGAFEGAGFLFGEQFKSVRGLRAYLTRFAGARSRS